MASYCTFWDPIAGQTVRRDSASTYCAGVLVASAVDSSILGGPLANPGSHTICTACSTIVMGNTNTINSNSSGYEGYNSILNCYQNRICYGCHNSLVLMIK